MISLLFFKTIIYHDKDGDGKISFEEFSSIVSNLNVDKKMVVDVWINVLQLPQPFQTQNFLIINSFTAL